MKEKNNAGGLTAAQNEPLLGVRHGTAYVTGNDHVKYPLGYQDAWCVLSKSGLLVAVVCDGCSTTSDSFTKNQFGAIIGAQILARYIFRKLGPQNKPDPQQILIECQKFFRRFFSRFLQMLETDLACFERKKFVAEHLTFTVLGIIIRDNQYWIFGCGDGCYGINYAMHHLESKGWLASLLTGTERQAMLTTYDSGVVQHNDIFWIATDGLLSLLRRESGMEDFQQFLRHYHTCARSDTGTDQTFKSFHQLTRRHPEVFSDDTTVVVARIEQTNNIETSPSIMEIKL